MNAFTSKASSARQLWRDASSTSAAERGWNSLYRVGAAAALTSLRVRAAHLARTRLEAASSGGSRVGAFTTLVLNTWRTMAD